MTQEQLHNLETTKNYFRKVDAQDLSLVKLFDEDLQLFFPKFGMSHGLAGLNDFAFVWGARFKEVTHHFDEFQYIVAGDSVVVEGSESGVLKDGGVWEHMRFCSVFAFKNGLITRMHVYADPDLTLADQDRLLWGKPKASEWSPGGDVISG